MNRKQKVTIIAIVVVTILLGALILLIDRPSAGGAEGGEHAEAGHGHGHEEAKGHADTEHHGEKAKDEHGHANEHGDKEHHEENEPTKGTHGGQVFTEGDFALEMVLAESNGQARLMAYPTTKGKPLALNTVKLSVTLTRPDGSKQEIGFAPQKDALVSNVAIAEPHVFDATIAAQAGNEPYLFSFAKDEGKIALSDAQLKTAGVTVQTAGPARIQSTLQLPGEIKFNQDRTAHVVPRITGIVESVPANLGQQVKKGHVLAVINSSTVSEQRSELLTAQERLSLARTTFQREKTLWEEKISAEQDYLQAQQALREAEIAVRNAQQKLIAMGATGASKGGLNRYELRAPFDGTVVEKHLSLGEALKEDANVFTIADLSTVWAEIVVPANQLHLVRVGETATVKSTAFDSTATGKVTYVGSLLGEQTRTATARVVLPNPQGAWRPGLFVNVELVANEVEAPVTVATDALQSIEDKTVVFIRVPGGFIPQPVVTGRSNGKLIEITKGLKPGVQYAATGSFVLKSELGKASAEHSH